MKLALGSAQFGMNYGITNTAGQVASSEVEAILRAARACGIKTIDTAAGYGASEVTLGQQLKSLSGFDLITKVAPGEGGPGAITSTVEQSCQRLMTASLYGVLLHDAASLLCQSAEQTYRELERLKQRGLVSRIGVSVYRPEEADRILEHYDIDLIQLPMNVLDQRFRRSGCLSRLKRRGVEIHARSLFLQGTLLSEPAALSPVLGPYHQVFERCASRRRELKLSALAFAIGFCHQNPDIDKFVVGVCSAEQLLQIYDAYRLPEALECDYESLACDDEGLLLPSRWHRAESLAQSRVAVQRLWSKNAV